MAIVPEHTHILEEILGIPSLVKGHVLSVGVQDLRFHGIRPPTNSWNESIFRLFLSVKKRLKPTLWAEYERVETFEEFLKYKGATSVDTLDLFDDRASINIDLNDPCPQDLHQNYDLLIDIGCLEHLFDTKQVIHNYINLVKNGGWLVIHVPVSGYFGHGLHVFNPQAILDSFVLNGFELESVCYSSRLGKILKHPHRFKDTILWLACKKVGQTGGFVTPMQKVWEQYYLKEIPEDKFAVQREYWETVESGSNGSNDSD